MSDIKTPKNKPSVQTPKGEKSKETQKTEDTYSKALNTLDDDKDIDDDVGGDEDVDLSDDSEGGDETSTVSTGKKGRQKTKTKKKRNRQLEQKKQAKKELVRSMQKGNIELSRQSGVQKKRSYRNYTGDEEDLNQVSNEEDQLDMDMGGSSGGNSDDQQGDKNAEDIQKENEILAKVKESEWEEALDKENENPNKAAIAYLKAFIEDNDPSKAHKLMLQKILNTIFKQCIKGLQFFPKDTPRHASLGKSANICKHALSALARDHINEVKKLLTIIMPKDKDQNHQ